MQMREVTAGLWIEAGGDRLRILAENRAGRSPLAEIAFEEHRARSLLAMLGGRRLLDVTVQPGALARVVASEAIEARRDGNAWCSAIEATVSRCGHDRGLWRRAEAAPRGLVPLLTGLGFPMLASAYDRGTAAVAEVPRWAAQVLARPNARQASAAAFGSRSTRRTTRALATSLVPLPGAPAAATVALGPLCLALVGRTVLEPDQLVDVLSERDIWHAPPVWLAASRLESAARIVEGLGPAAATRLLLDAAGRPRGIELLLDTLDLYRCVRHEFRTIPPRGLDALRDACSVLAPAPAPAPAPTPTPTPAAIVAATGTENRRRAAGRRPAAPRHDEHAREPGDPVAAPAGAGRPVATRDIFVPRNAPPTRATRSTRLPDCFEHPAALREMHHLAAGDVRLVLPAHARGPRHVGTAAGKLPRLLRSHGRGRGRLGSRRRGARVAGGLRLHRPRHPRGTPAPRSRQPAAISFAHGDDAAPPRLPPGDRLLGGRLTRCRPPIPPDGDNGPRSGRAAGPKCPMSRLVAQPARTAKDPLRMSDSTGMGMEADNHSTLGRRSLRALSALMLMAGASLATWGAPALAADSPDFAANASPLSYGGNDYDDLISGPGSGAIFVPASDAGSTEVTTDGTPVPGIPGQPGLYDYDVALIRSGDAYITMYIDAAMLEHFTGGPYSHTCSGAVAFLTTMSGEGSQFSCDNFEKSILVANAPYEDFTFTGYGDFENAGSVAPVSGFSDPALTFVGTLPPYFASNTPLSYGGNDYDAVLGGGAEARSAGLTFRAADAGDPQHGSLWLVDFEPGPQSVTSDNTRIPGIPDSDEQHSVDVFLLTVDGARVTLYVSSIWRTGTPGSPYEASCAGWLALMDAFESEETFTCLNFKADIFTPTGAGKDFTFTGFDGFENSGTVRAVAGYSSPPWLTHGSYTPSATTTTTAAPTVTTTTAAPQATTTTAATATTTTTAPVASTTAAPAAAILPVTGPGGRGGVTIIAIALLAAGLALQRGARARRETKPVQARID